MVKNNSTKVLSIGEFVFTAKPENLYPLLNEIIDEAKGILASRFSEPLEGRCRMIITELLTNALKHSDSGQSLITLLIGGSKMTIIRSDSGRPLHLAEWQGRKAVQWPVEEPFTKKEIVVYEDDMCRLLGMMENPCRIKFFTEDLPVVIPPRPKNLLEHFGLMILAKSSDEFVYHYDTVSRTNFFQASVFI